MEIILIYIQNKIILIMFKLLDHYYYLIFQYLFKIFLIHNNKIKILKKILIFNCINLCRFKILIN